MKFIKNWCYYSVFFFIECYKIFVESKGYNNKVGNFVLLCFFDIDVN